MVPANEAFIHRFHRHARALDIARPGEDGPALRNRINLSFGVSRRSQRRAIVEVGAAVPLAIPAILLDILAHVSRLPPATFGEGYVTVPVGNLSEPHEDFIQEKPQPDTFACAVLPHNVHAVVPVTGADERQAVLTKSEAPQNGAHTVFVQTGRFFGPAGQIVIRVLLRAYRAAFDEVDGFIQHPGVPRVQNVAARRQGQPEVIIRTVCTHTPARGGMPPVLNISLLELTGRAAE